MAPKYNFSSPHQLFSSPHQLFSSPHQLFSSPTNCSLLRTTFSLLRTRRHYSQRCVVKVAALGGLLGQHLSPRDLASRLKLNGWVCRADHGPRAQGQSPLVKRGELKVLEKDIPEINAWEQYLNKQSGLKSVILIKYGTLSTRNNY